MKPVDQSVVDSVKSHLREGMLSRVVEMRVEDEVWERVDVRVVWPVWDQVEEPFLEDFSC